VVKDPRKPMMISAAICGGSMLFSLRLQTTPIIALPTIFTERVARGKEELMEFTIACDSNHLKAAPKDPPSITSPRVAILLITFYYALLKRHRFYIKGLV